MPKLVFRVNEPGQAPREIDVVRDLTIGRHPDNACVINDPKCSSRHAVVITASDGAFLIQDVGSSNKTIVRNGPTLQRNETHLLKAGDEITIGNTTFTVVAKTPTVAATQMMRPPVAAEAPMEPSPEDRTRLSAGTPAPKAPEVPVAAKAVEAKPAAAAERKPEESKPAPVAEVKPEAAKPAEPKPVPVVAEVKSVERPPTPPAAEAAPAAPKAVEVATPAAAPKAADAPAPAAAPVAPAAESKPAPVKPAEPKPAVAEAAPAPAPSAPAPPPVVAPPPIVVPPVEAAPKPVAEPKPAAAVEKPAPAPKPAEAAAAEPKPAPAPSPVAKPAAPKPEAPKPAPAPKAEPAKATVASPPPNEDVSGGTQMIIRADLNPIATLGAFKVANARLIFGHEAIRKRVDVSTLEFGIGRTLSPEVQCQVDLKPVSGRHARISFRSNRFWIEDLGSTNHTFLGNEMLAANVPREVQGESHVRFGSIDALFVVDVNPEGAKTDQNRFESAADILEQDGRITKQARAKVAGEMRAKGESAHMGEELVLAGLVTVEQWCDAFARAKLIRDVKRTSSGPQPNVMYIMIAVIVVLVAVILFFVFKSK